MLKAIIRYNRFAKYLIIVFGLACAASLTVIFSYVVLDKRIPIGGSAPVNAISIQKDITKPLIVGKPPAVTAAKVKPDYVIPAAVNGSAPVLATIPTKQPVVFLGIDDGAFKDVSEVQMMKDNDIKASLYLAKSFTIDSPDFFKQIAANGSLIENHSLSHYLDLSKRSYSAQKAEICGQADYMQTVYGRRPIFFRPPGGSYNSDTLRAANDCGMKAVVTWIAKVNGGSMQYQIGNKLRAGDIVLMHFRPEFKQDLQAFIDAKNAAGLQVVLLENWLTSSSFE